MRSAKLLFILLALAGCGDRRTFDDRYSATANDLEQRATKLDAELNSVDGDEP